MDSKVRLIHEVHDMWPATLVEVGGMSKRHPFVQLIQIAENYAYRKCDALVSIPPFAKDYMVQHGLEGTKFNHIPNGIVMEEWKNSEELPVECIRQLKKLRQNKKFIVGYFGGHALSNALDLLLDSAKLLKNYNNVIYVLVGDGCEKKRLIQRSVNEEINNVIFLDPVPKKSIPRLLSFFDCIYISMAKSPLYRFGIGLNKLYDSMMAAKPIVLSVTTPDTIVQEYDCGIVVEAEDTVGVKNAIIKILDMPPEQRREMGERGKEAVEKNFEYKKLAKDFENVMGDRKKNILLINHYAGSPDMGMEFRPYYFAREWVKNGYHVDIIAADYSHLRINNPRINKDFEEQVIDGIHYHWVHTNKYEGNGAKRAVTMFQFVGKLWLHAMTIAREMKPDVVITSSTYPLDTYAGRRIKKLSRNNIRNNV